MSVDIDGMEWSVHPVDPILLNALVDRNRESASTLADDASLKLVADAFETVLDKDTRDRFDDIAQNIRSDTQSVSDGDNEVIKAVVDGVREYLAKDGVSAVVTHKNSLLLSTNEALVYTFSMTRDAAVLSELDVKDDVADAIAVASGAIDDSKWEQAARELEDAVATAMTTSDSIVTRTVRALCCHWAGQDQQAIDLVGEAVSLDSNTWLPWLPGYRADADPAYATTDQFREDKYAVAAFMRYVAKVPNAATITPAIGYPSEKSIEWTKVDSNETCFPVDRLDGETHIRFQIEGPVDAFPAFQAYYIGLGIMDLEVNEIRDVLDVLEDGPTGERVTETVRFERSA